MPCDKSVTREIKCICLEKCDERGGWCGRVESTAAELLKHSTFAQLRNTTSSAKRTFKVSSYLLYVISFGPKLPQTTQKIIKQGK